MFYIDLEVNYLLQQPQGGTRNSKMHLPSLKNMPPFHFLMWYC